MNGGVRLPVHHRLTVDGTCTCGFASHKVRSVRIHITKSNARNQVTLTDCIAIGNTDSSGFDIREGRS